MRLAGIDIGSRTVKLAILEDGQLVQAARLDNSYDPVEICNRILEDQQYDEIVATGYGRHIFKENFGGSIISEISAFSKGVALLHPQCRTIIDIGGQDTKVISLTEDQKLAKFEMNDKCAAGTGRFLEIMAVALGYRPEEFWRAAMSAEESVTVNNMCTVFAESEVISLTAKGIPRPSIARGLHESIARRAAGMLRRLDIVGEVVFAGGVAHNACIRSMLADEIGHSLTVPEDPQIIGAVGAALVRSRQLQKMS